MSARNNSAARRDAVRLISQRHIESKIDVTKASFGSNDNIKPSYEHKLKSAGVVRILHAGAFFTTVDEGVDGIHDKNL